MTFNSVSFSFSYLKRECLSTSKNFLLDLCTYIFKSYTHTFTKMYVLPFSEEFSLQ